MGARAPSACRASSPAERWGKGGSGSAVPPLKARSRSAASAGSAMQMILPR